MDISGSSSQNPTLGYGSMLNASDEEMDALDQAARLAPAGAYLRLWMSSPSNWRASASILNSAAMRAFQLKRATDQMVALEWQNMGNGIDWRGSTISSLIRAQAGEIITWSLEQVGTAGTAAEVKANPVIPSQGGTQSNAPNNPPFGAGSNGLGLDPGAAAKKAAEDAAKAIVGPLLIVGLGAIVVSIALSN